MCETRPNSRQTAPLPLTTHGLCYRIDNRTLIDNIEMSCSEPGTTVILGPNGAGKSLLLRLLHGLIQPTAGEIRWAGMPNSPAIRRHQAMVFQNPVLLRRSTAANIDFVLKLPRHAPAIDRDALLTRVGLLDQRRQPARLLSGGEQQRLALARALASAPSVLFLDEPTANLDPASVATIEAIVQDIGQSGTKVFFVTHDRAQAQRLAHEVVFLHRGQLRECTPAGRFFTAARSAEAQAYLDGRIIL